MKAHNMGDIGFGDVLAGMDSSAKKELLNRLVGSVLNDLSEAEKRALLQTLLAGRQESRPLVDMVEH